jgi:hypothetical protein
MSFPIAYGFLTIDATRAQTRCGQTLEGTCVRQSAPSKTALTMDIERINLIGTSLADLSARTEALRGYL